LTDVVNPDQPAPGVVYGGPTKKLASLSADDEPIYGGTLDKSEHVLTGAGSHGFTHPPEGMYDYLPSLLKVAQDPNAPASLNALLDVLDIDRQNAVPAFGRFK
jgi:hypothetical protein